MTAHGYESPPTVPDDFGRFCRNRRIRIKEHWVHPRAFEIWPQCIAVERMSRDELLALQQRRMKELLEHVLEHVPFYQRWAKECGWRKGDAVRLEDLPIVSKADYRQELEAFRSDAFPAERIAYEKTSGSTGEPFRFGVLKWDQEHRYCTQWRGMARFGLRPGDRRVLVWGRSPVFTATPAKRRIARMRQGIRDWFNNTILIDAHSLDHRSAGSAIARIERFGPVYLHGYVSSLYELARHLVERGHQLSGLKAVVTDAEKLYDFQKQAMEQAFGCPILEQYGSVETGIIAQCDPQGIMRINEDEIIVERLPSGEAVLTCLSIFACPFIRYRNGDLVELEEGIVPPLPYRSISQITGRSIDRVPLAGGGAIHGFVLLYAVSPHLKYIRRYQIHQTALDEFTIRCVVTAPLPGEVRERMMRDFRAAVGEKAKVRIEEVEEIPLTAGGKFRWLVSDISRGAERGGA